MKKQVLIPKNVKNILSDLKSMLNVTTDSELADILGVKTSTFSMWKARNSLDYELFFKFCGEHGLDLNTIIFNDYAEQVEESQTKYIVSSNNFEKIPLFYDIQVVAGHALYNKDSIIPDNYIQLPSNLLKKYNHYICIRTKGESMAPTIHDSSYIIARLLNVENWIDMPDEHIYIIVTNEGLAFIKRIKNRLAQNFIVCMSDNPDKASFANFNLLREEIRHIWHAEWYLSARMPNIHDQFYNRLKRIEDDLEVLKTKIK